MKIMQTMLIFAGLILVLALPAFGSDIYITQNASGADTGADCANARSAAWFNANASGGNTYHLCGTFTGTAGSTMLTPPNSGSAESVVNIVFEQDAILTAPYWSNAIHINGKSYITIDGSYNGTECGYIGHGTTGTKVPCNGVIQNTANGTVLTYQQSSAGIVIASGSSHIEIKNLTIQNIYANGGSSSAAKDIGGKDTADIYLDGSVNNILIHNNILNNARAGINYGYHTSADLIEIYNNYISDHCWGIAIGASSGPASITNVSIYDNEITDWGNWAFPSATYHTDGMIIWQARGGTFVPLIYNNYLHGDLGGGSATAFIFVTYGGGASGTATGGRIFNNVIKKTSGAGAHIWIGSYTTGIGVYNNTMEGYAHGGYCIAIDGTGHILKNNSCNNAARAIYSSPVPSASITTIVSACDFNNVYNISDGLKCSPCVNGPYPNCSTWFSVYSGGGSGRWNCPDASTSWQAVTGFDKHSISADPDISSTFAPNAGSPLIGVGENLTSLEITALNSDAGGRPRPATGAWDVGAYQYPSVSTISPPQDIRIAPSN